MRDLKKEKTELQKRYRQHLRRVKNEHHLYDKEIALLMGMNVNQADYVRKMRNNEAEIHTCDMVTLSQSLISEYNDASLLQEMVPEGFLAYAVKGGRRNGRVDDEINNITMYSGKILEAVRDDDSDSEYDIASIIKYARKIAEESATIKEEIS